MNPQDALTTGRNFLDEATENITFEEFAWAFEEAWHGVAWALNSLRERPLTDVGSGEKGAVPKKGSLILMLGGTPNPPKSARVVRQFEEAHPRFEARDLTPKDIEKLVFAAWELHDDCGTRLRVEDDRLGDKLMLAEVSPGRVGSRTIERRTALKLLAVSSVLPLQACSKIEKDNRPVATEPQGASKHPGKPADVAEIVPIRGMQWPTIDPFLFCAHHRDDYPEGNENMGPQASLDGRHLGRDFETKDGWNMYHGRIVPGFPRHPHRGFETVTVVRQGLLDHADSMGATARYGNGDVQWLTAGGGIQHAEMFPLLRSEEPNPLELFQIWLNLPRVNKMVPPHFTMLWDEKIPRVTRTDKAGRKTTVTLSAGTLDGQSPPAPPPNSWASDPASDLAIWSIKMEAGAVFEMPAVNVGTVRALYVHEGESVKIGTKDVAKGNRARVNDNGVLTLVAGSQPIEVLLLQARPLDEPVAKRGPFVMNTQDEIRQAYADYQRTQFGGWPWNANGPVHDRQKGRFAKLLDGSFEEPT